jgi:hypothetical protein
LKIRNANQTSCNKCIGGKADMYAKWSMKYSKYNKLVTTKSEKQESSLRKLSTRWFKYDRDYLCVNKSQFVPVIFEPPCTISINNLASLLIPQNVNLAPNWSYRTQYFTYLTTHKDWHPAEYVQYYFKPMDVLILIKVQSGLWI